MTYESSTPILVIPRPIDANNDDTDNHTILNEVFTSIKKRGREFVCDDSAVYLSYQPGLDNSRSKFEYRYITIYF